MRKFTLCLFAVGLSLVPALGAPGHWVGSWMTSPASAVDVPHYDHQTLREIVHPTLGGGQVRVRISNVFGAEALQIGLVHVAARLTGASIDAGSDRALTFGGHDAVTIPPGALAVSDPVWLHVQAGEDLAVSMYLPVPTAVTTAHWGSGQTSYLSQAGDFSAVADLPVAVTLQSWPFLTGLDVMAPPSTRCVVALGDSITDGAGSTDDANHRWPDRLAQRLRNHGVAVLNAGISGNRILHDSPSAQPAYGISALARFERDVVAQPGVTDVMVLEGVNDINFASEAVTADQVIGGLAQLLERAHEHGLRMYGGTIAPSAVLSSTSEAARQSVNAWIRHQAHYDGVVDFDAVLQDPSAPTHLQPAFDSGDHLHPSDAGYQAMADAIDLSWFR